MDEKSFLVEKIMRPLLDDMIVDEKRSVSSPRNQGVRCWEFMNCPESEMRKCMAVLQNMERRCWLVVGTSSGINDMATCAVSVGDCKSCGYYGYMKDKSYDKEKQVNILLVEDETVIAMEIEERLIKLGYNVCGSASTGEKAIRLAEEMRPDLVLMDIRLKGDMDGIEAAEEISEEFDIPVIFLTAHSDNDTFSRAKLTGPSAFIIKPYREKDIYSNIEITLHNHKIRKYSLKRIEGEREFHHTKNEAVSDRGQEMISTIEEIINETENAMAFSSDNRYLNSIKEKAETLGKQLKEIIRINRLDPEELRDEFEQYITDNDE